MVYYVNLLKVEGTFIGFYYHWYRCSVFDVLGGQSQGQRVTCGESRPPGFDFNLGRSLSSDKS